MTDMHTDQALVAMLASPRRQTLTFTYAGTQLAVVGVDNAALAVVARALKVARTRRQPDGTYTFTPRHPEQMPRPGVPIKGSRGQRRPRAGR